MNIQKSVLKKGSFHISQCPKCSQDKKYFLQENSLMAFMCLTFHLSATQVLLKQHAKGNIATVS